MVFGCFLGLYSAAFKESLDVSGFSQSLESKHGIGHAFNAEFDITGIDILNAESLDAVPDHIVAVRSRKYRCISLEGIAY